MSILVTSIRQFGKCQLITTWHTRLTNSIRKNTVKFLLLQIVVVSNCRQKFKRSIDIMEPTNNKNNFHVIVLLKKQIYISTFNYHIFSQNKIQFFWKLEVQNILFFCTIVNIHIVKFIIISISIEFRSPLIFGAF